MIGKISFAITRKQGLTIYDNFSQFCFLETTPLAGKRRPPLPRIERWTTQKDSIGPTGLSQGDDLK